MSNEVLNIIVGIIGGLVTAALTFILYTYQKKASYDAKHHKVILEEVRASMEKQIYMLNERLMKNDERWRDVNHLLLRKEYTVDRPILLNKKVLLNDFLKSNGITENDLVIDKELIFVLTPFNSMFSEEYDKIRNICSDVGFKCFRGDEAFFSSDIFPEMLRLIIKANLIIANLNGKNANVLYELGIAQALDKPVILIAKNAENLPIDVQSKRFLIYNSLQDLDLMLKSELIKILRLQLAEISNSQNVVLGSNPIINYARYGTPSAFIDITQKIKELVSANSLISATNEIWGDPIPGSPKTLEINYTINNETKHISINEGDTYRFT